MAWIDKVDNGHLEGTGHGDHFGDINEDQRFFLTALGWGWVPHYKEYYSESNDSLDGWVLPVAHHHFRLAVAPASCMVTEDEITHYTLKDWVIAAIETETIYSWRRDKKKYEREFVFSNKLKQKDMTKFPQMSEFVFSKDFICPF
tara:strand:- start:270 stop:704 length:435 start_codon:yes stop_codon:yes gene_type:complete